LRIAVLSDTHIPTRLSHVPGKVYEVCSEADLVLHAGDHVEREVLTDLERMAPVKAVRGNMDGPDLSYLPDSLTLDLEGHRVCMTHGSGAPVGLSKRVYRIFEGSDPEVIVFGHSHLYTHKRKNGVIILNPGAVCGRSGHRTMAVLTLIEGKPPSIEKVAF
jgi:hypothetical protein